MSSQEPQAVSGALHAARERRARTRHPLALPARVRLRGPGLPNTPIQMLDLSEDGLGLQMEGHLHADRTLALDLDLISGLDTPHCVRVIGQVAWAQDSGRAGVRFFSPDHAALQEIQQWLFLNAVASARLPEILPLASQMAENPRSQDIPETELFADEEPPDLSGSPVLSPLLRDINAIVSRALALTGAKGAALALREGDQLICRAICGTDTPALGARIATDSGLTGECIRLARVMYCADASGDERVNREVCADLGIRSILALPLFAGERVVGLLEVLSQRPEAFDPVDAKALDLLARPVIGSLFAEGKAEGLRRGVRDVPEASKLLPQSAPEIVQEDEIDVAALERRRVAFARSILPGRGIVQRALAAVAAVAVFGAVIWLVVSQTNVLASLRTQPQPPAATTLIQAQVPHASSLPDQTPLDASESLKGLKAAAQKGDADAQYTLASRYSGGDGVPQDSSAAARWFALAAKQGNAKAQGMLGSCYWAGRGVPKDLKQAYFWSVLARDGNDEISKDRVDALVARLGRSDMLEVQVKVRDWYRKHPPSFSPTSPEGSR